MNELLNYFNGEEIAANVFLSKYAAEGETLPDHMHERMAKEFYRMHKQTLDYDYEKNKLYNEVSSYGKQLITFLDSWEKFFGLLEGFDHIVPQGSVMSNLGTKLVTSLSNCFVIGQPEDSYGGIMQKDEELVQLMKRRGGVGIDISTLRPSEAPVTNSAKTSTGAVSFMPRYSNSTREVAQGGRRGALMITLDIRHPDIQQFINVKRDRTQITGANISVMLRDDFMEAVEKDEDYILRWPCNYDLSEMEECQAEYNQLFPITNIQGENIAYYKRIKAKEVYDQIVENAWENAEPGQIFVDRHWNYSPDSVYSQFKGVTTNPCGEIFMQVYDACRLILLNLLTLLDKYSTSDDVIKDDERIYSYFYQLQWFADLLVDLELEYILRIINKIKKDPTSVESKTTELNLWTNIYNTAKASRRTGSGITALGDLLAWMHVKYDSDQGLAIIEQVMSLKMEAELECMIDLAILKGSFEGWNPELEFDIVNGKAVEGKNEFYQFLLEYYPEQVDKMIKYGRRNVSWSTVAPAGTVSLMTQTTSGMEPLFMPFYTRRKKINSNDKDSRIDFKDQSGDNWQEFPVIHEQFRKWIVEFDPGINVINLTASDLTTLFESSPWYGSTANDINWMKRVEIQGIIQKYTSHSISSTINLPSTATKQDVADIYLHSWKSGLKGVTVYRDGCRTGVLVSDNNTKTEFKEIDATKRPKILPAEGYKIRVKGEEWIILIGLLDNKPYEIFATENMWNIPSSFNCDIIKNNKKSYTINIKDEKVIEDFTSNVSSEEESVSRLISTSLRHGVHIKYIVEQLSKSYGTINSFSKAIIRVLKKYIPEGELSTLTCLECGSNHIIFEEGCQKCTNCGSSKCG